MRGLSGALGRSLRRGLIQSTSLTPVTPAPAAYYDSGAGSSTATKGTGITFDNGMYEALTRLGGTVEWKSVQVVDGTVRECGQAAAGVRGPSNGNIDRLQLYGPKATAAKATGVYGPNLKYCSFYNSLGHTQVGIPTTVIAARLVYSSTSPDVAPGHQGWCPAGPYYFLCEQDVLYRRIRNPGGATDWNADTSFTTGINAVTGRGAHLGQPGYRASKAYVYCAVSDWTGSAATTSKFTLCAFKASDGTLAGWWPVFSVAGRVVDGIAFDEVAGKAYINDYGHGGNTYVIDLATLDATPSGSAVAYATLSDPMMEAVYTNFQGCMFYQGLVWAAGKHKGAVAGTMMVGKDPMTGRMKKLWYFGATSAGGQEGFAVDTIGGVDKVGIMWSDSGTGQDHVDYYLPPVDPTYSKNGITVAGLHGLVYENSYIAGSYTFINRSLFVTPANSTAPTQLSGSSSAGATSFLDNLGSGTTHRASFSGQVPQFLTATGGSPANAVGGGSGITNNTHTVIAGVYDSSAATLQIYHRTAAQTTLTAGTPSSGGAVAALVANHPFGSSCNPGNRTLQGQHRGVALFTVPLNQSQIEAVDANWTLALDFTDALTAPQKAAAQAT